MLDREPPVRVGLREFRLTMGVCIPSFVGIALTMKYPADLIMEVIKNVLIIFCRVTIWQPFQSLVFDRWMQAEQANVYHRIAGMDISVAPA